MSLNSLLNVAAGFSQIKRISIFLFVGGFATALHYVLMFALITAAGWEPIRASAAGFLTSSLVNFFLNARFTFESEHPILHTAPRFALVAAIGLILNNSILALLLFLKIHPFICQIGATLCVLSWNYIVNAIWTFKTEKR